MLHKSWSRKEETQVVEGGLPWVSLLSDSAQKGELLLEKLFARTFEL